MARENEGRLLVPGSILRLDLDTSQPLGYGMKDRTMAFFAFSSAFETSSGMETVARYAAEDPLVSGWIEGGSVIAGRSAVVQTRAGDGRIILFGFPVQHRGQSFATFRLLFNAVLSAPTATPPKPRSRR